MTGARGVRERVREELTREIKEVARRHLSERGAAALSVRAITRELGMASSAVYRYFPSRDALLTALIIDAYEGVGSAASNAEENVPREDHADRWTAVFHAVRGWALDHPHEYALIYGSPVPGYVAPDDTASPASEVVLLLAAIVVDAAHGPGLDDPPDPAELPPALSADIEARVDELVGVIDASHVAALRSLPHAVVIRVIDAWTLLFGAVSFELFGHYHRVIDARAEHLDRLARHAGRAVGIPGI